MKKRSVILFSVMLLSFSFLVLRLYTLSRNTVYAEKASPSMSVDIGSVRGTIYDCNMKPLTNIKKIQYAAIKPSAQALSELKGKLNETDYENIKERISKGKPVIIPVDKSIISSKSVEVFTVPQRYDGSLACHIIGYLDFEGKGISGIEKAFEDTLSKYSETASVRFRADAGGNILNGAEIELNGCTTPKGGTVLTIDRDIQKTAEDALDKFNIQKGCVIILDIKTGAIKACASTPCFSPDNTADSLNDENSPFINRAFLPFNAGSVFKSVIAAAALENGIDDFEFECTGSVDFSNVTFNCHKKDGHGMLNLTQAIAYSCNTFFATLGQRVGAENIIKTAKAFGFGKSTEAAPGIKSSGGNLPEPTELDSSAAIANISFGQGALTATPLQICAMTAAIANDGKYCSPYLVEGETDGDGNFSPLKTENKPEQIITVQTAKALQNALKAVVDYGSGSRAKSDTVTTAGKTATAQTGKFNSDGEIYNAWFSGYFPADVPEYAVTVLKEDGGEGAVSAAPVFRYIAENTNTK